MDQRLPAGLRGFDDRVHPSGSAAGIQDFVNSQTSFAGSDSALNADQQTQANTRCANNEAWNLPMVGGAIAVAYNVSGCRQVDP